MLILTPLRSKRPVKASPVNWPAPSASSGQALVSIENLRFPLPQRLVQDLDTEAASRVLESRQATTYRLYQSMIATRYKKPLVMAM